MFNVFYQTGILLGPVVDLASTAADFSLTCLVAAAVFAVLTVLQVRSLPGRRTDSDRKSLVDDGRSVFGDRSFVWFACR